MTTTREDLDKRWPPKRKFQPPQSARGMDATEFVARYGEITARVDVHGRDKQENAGGANTEAH